MGSDQVRTGAERLVAVVRELESLRRRSLSYPDLATREKNWNTFRNDPEWKKLSTTPGYTDAEIVASITNVFLTPAPYSQI